MPTVFLLDGDDDIPADFVLIPCEGGCGRSGWLAPQSAQMTTVDKLCQSCYWLKRQIDDFRV
jgi:hypothetical protein